MRASTLLDDSVLLGSAGALDGAGGGINSDTCTGLRHNGHNGFIRSEFSAHSAQNTCAHLQREGEWWSEANSGCSRSDCTARRSNWLKANCAVVF